MNWAFEIKYNETLYRKRLSTSKQKVLIKSYITLLPARQVCSCQYQGPRQPKSKNLQDKPKPCKADKYNSFVIGCDGGWKINVLKLMDNP